jgi:type IX secretion system PorP/SprF family membrane protein
MKKLCILFVAGLSVGSVCAQQDALYTHYMYNTLAINPAYAGSRDALTMTALGRFQWVGFSGAPMTQTFTAHAPVAWQSLGLGLSVVNDKIGPTTTTAFYADVAYRMKVSEYSRLSFGLKGGMNNFTAGLEDVKLQNQNDVSFAQGIRSKMLPNVGFGIYFQSRKFYAGLSIPKLLENKFYGDNANTSVNIGSEKRHYFFITGAIFDLTPQLKFKPTLLTKVATSAPIQMDLTANFIINDLVTLGAMYRTGDAFGVLAGVNVTEQFLLSYSFDWSTTNMTGRYNSGSHELLLRYDLVFHKEKRIKSPRYF